MNAKSDSEVEKEFTRLIADGFIPEFGNQVHIDVVKTFNEISKLSTELSKKEAASKGADTLRRDILSKKKNVIYWLGKK